MQNGIFRTPLGITLHCKSISGCSCNSQNKGWPIAEICKSIEKIENYIWEIMFVLKCNRMDLR